MNADVSGILFNLAEKMFTALPQQRAVWQLVGKLSFGNIFPDFVVLIANVLQIQQPSSVIERSFTDTFEYQTLTIFDPDRISAFASFERFSTAKTLQGVVEQKNQAISVHRFPAFSSSNQIAVIKCCKLIG